AGAAVARPVPAGWASPAERSGRVNGLAAGDGSRRPAAGQVSSHTAVLPPGRVPQRPLAASAQVAVVAAVAWAALGGTGLVRQARAVGSALEDGDVATARALLPNLCGRDPRSLG